MYNISWGIFFLGLVLLFGVALNRFSRFLKMPILLCFLGVGVVCGKYGLNLFPNLTMNGIQIFGEIALSFIMFNGGLMTPFKSIRSVFATGTVLATAGVVLTALFLAVFSYFVSHQLSIFYSQTFAVSLMGASVLSSTDAAAVFAILRGQKATIHPRLQSLLEYESGSNDPAAFLLTSIMISIVSSQCSVDVLGISRNIVFGIAWGLGMGAAVGFFVGILGQWFYNWIQSFLEYNGLRFVTAIAIVLCCCGLAKAVFHANILMACYAAGITMGNLRFNFKQFFIRVHDGFSWLMQIMLFTALGCFFDYHMLFNFRNMLGAVLASLFLMAVVRPAVVMLCMIRSPFSLRERLFTGWVGIRGSAPIMLAAMVVASFPKGLGMPTENLFYMVFTIVLFSILLQGSTIMWVARKLGLVMPYGQEKETLLNYEGRADGTELHDFTIAENSPLSGQNLTQSGLKDSAAVLLMIKRGKKVLQQTPDLVLQQGDLLSFLGKREAMTSLHAQFFPGEEYVFSPTFQQLWEDFLQQNMKKFRRSPRKKSNH